MSLTLLDWLTLTLILSTPILVGIKYYRRASSGIVEFFLSNRDMPWWLAGTSMVATTFAADTPLVVTGLVATNGIAGNWLWWNAGLGSMLTTAFFSRLWRRAGILTDIEFTELRYTGRPAAFLRGFRAIYLGLAINCLIIGWVNLAMSKVLSVTLGWDKLTAVFVGLAATGLYSTLAGLRGVVITDFLLFVFAMIGSLGLSYFALAAPEVGGLNGLVDQLPPSTFNFLPNFGMPSGSIDNYSLPVTAFIAYLGVQWWANWYPGQEPGGGGYIAQRMFSTRNEQHSLFAMLWFTVAHYCLRPWPWIIVALASLVLYPGLADAEAGYAMVIRDYVPSGWKGLLVGTFFAAYMSTVSTQLNWGSSYLVNDVYTRFFRMDAHDSELVVISRLTTVVLMLLSAVVTFYLDSIRQAWEFALECGAGVGLVLILRWYWWRITAISEITALIAAATGFFFIRVFTDISFPDSLLYLVPWTTACWLAVTWLTPAEPLEHLILFYRRVRPAGPGWAPVAAAVDGKAKPPDESLFRLGLNWFAGCIFLYGLLIGLGNLLFGSFTSVATSMLFVMLSATWLYRDLATRNWNTEEP